ncbi:hypothetical protein HJG60_009495 [Phyllostomus discolor]|uniref:Uncharacterized protein n=1 Tax=Phyllostomus discolor TaxID=89673 RepID=A0A834DDL1_9CHIR|nr:hypothetical protein HJG60_009495 [Phyllostomus discolor]
MHQCLAGGEGWCGWGSPTGRWPVQDLNLLYVYVLESMGNVPQATDFFSFYFIADKKDNNIHYNRHLAQGVPEISPPSCLGDSTNYISKGSLGVAGGQASCSAKGLKMLTLRVPAPSVAFLFPLFWNLHLRLQV